MDLRQYFRKLEQVEASLTEAFPTVVSLDTADGGKEGLTSEMSRSNAAKLIVEGRARLASEEEKNTFAEALLAARMAAEAAETARRVQVTIVSQADLDQVSGRGKNGQNK